MFALIARPRPAANVRSQHIASLTGLRFVAAFMIVVLHSYQGFDIPDLRGVLNLGAGVNFFFVLSGFVIAHRYHTLQRDEVPRYLAARVARIFPVHLLTLVAYVAFATVAFPFQYDMPLYQKALVLLANVSLMQAHIPMPEYYFSLNAVSWSLSCELFFYVSAVFLFVGGLNLRKALWTFSILVVVALLSIAYAQGASLSELGKEGQFDITKIGMVLTWPLSKAHEFALGILLQQLHQRFIIQTKRPVVADAAGLAIWGAGLFGSTYLMRSLELDLVTAELVMTLVCSGACAVLIWLFSYELSQVSTTVFGNPIMVKLGEASFSLYMIHLPLLRLIQRISPGELLSMGWWVAYVLSCMVLAHVVYTWVEVPCRQRILQWYQDSHQRQAIPAER